MCARLVKEVIRTMPATIKPNEWKLVVVLADGMDNGTREGRFPGGREALCERMGMSDYSVKRSLKRLADLGYELRITIGAIQAGENKGDPVFAVHGTETTYLIPVF